MSHRPDKLVDTTKPPLCEFAKWHVSWVANAMKRARHITRSAGLYPGDDPSDELLDMYGPTAVLVNRRQFREAFTELTTSDAESLTRSSAGLRQPKAGARGGQARMKFVALPLYLFNQLLPRKDLEGPEVFNMNGGKFVDASEAILQFVMFGQGARMARARLCYEVFFKPRLETKAGFRLHDVEELLVRVWGGAVVSCMRVLCVVLCFDGGGGGSLRLHSHEKLWFVLGTADGLNARDFWTDGSVCRQDGHH